MRYINTTDALREEIRCCNDDSLYLSRSYYMGIGYSEHLTDPIPIARAYAFKKAVESFDKYVYENDIILGSLRSQFEKKPDDESAAFYENICRSYGDRGWLQGRDHYASAYDRLLDLGIHGILSEIKASKKTYASDKQKLEFLEACQIEMEAFSEMINAFSEKASDPEIAALCHRISTERPESFHEALQLVWFAHLAYLYKGLYAMAFGRMDQYLYPYYRRDIDAGIITREDVCTLLENAFVKIHEHTIWYGYDDVCNICIGGITSDGRNAVNDLSYDILTAVKNCRIPGPNLSARIHPDNPDEFLCAALRVIGTGIGYPALMNDIPNIKALQNKGFRCEDANDYCMVGCIENFVAGKQPPWHDGRFNTVKLLELTLNRGRDMRTGEACGIDTGDPCGFLSMQDFMSAFERQIAFGAKAYVSSVIAENALLNNANFVNPFMSCLAYDCIEKGLDICNGGSRYPSAHGACGMGIGTIADSLAAIEKCIFTEKSITMSRLLEALRANFVGYDEERAALLAAPKYGNDMDAADKYAVWFVNYTADIFDRYRLADGGRFYTAIASNVANIPAGKECAASPDGRLAGEPLSDAASPTYGKDIMGPTYTVYSLSKPDYSRVATGTVVNQKYTSDIFRGEENIKRLCALIRIYFERGGQEMQINCVSRKELLDAMEHPENYKDLIVRVSGFSAYFTELSREVQLDILARTEQA